MVMVVVVVVVWRLVIVWRLVAKPDLPLHPNDCNAVDRYRQAHEERKKSVGQGPQTGVEQFPVHICSAGWIVVSPIPVCSGMVGWCDGLQ